jgi:hypothetical protein
MSARGVDVSKVKLMFYTEKQRGIHAAKDIKKGEIVLFVPYSEMLTL